MDDLTIVLPGAVVLRWKHVRSFAYSLTREGRNCERTYDTLTVDFSNGDRAVYDIEPIPADGLEEELAAFLDDLSEL